MVAHQQNPAVNPPSPHSEATLVIDRQCVVPETLFLPNRFVLAGVGTEGRGVLVFDLPDNQPAIRFAPSNDGDLRFVTIRDLNLVGTACCGQVGIDVSNSSLVYLERIRLHGFGYGVVGRTSYSIHISGQRHPQQRLQPDPRRRLDRLAGARHGPQPERPDRRRLSPHRARPSVLRGPDGVQPGDRDLPARGDERGRTRLVRGQRHRLRRPRDPARPECRSEPHPRQSVLDRRRPRSGHLDPAVLQRRQRRWRSTTASEFRAALRPARSRRCRYGPRRARCGSASSR